MRINLTDATSLLINGKVVAIPTETVYGLAASIVHEDAVHHIFSLKRRPQNNPLIIHAANLDQVKSYVDALPPHAELLAQTFWPGPLTLVLPCNTQKISSQIRAGLPTAAFRIPHHPLALEVLQHTGPLVMPSANLSGKPSATSPDHVEADFGFDFPVLDGGPCSLGLESTILFYSEETKQWHIIRQGALSAENFTAILDYTPTVSLFTKNHSPLCPGQLYRHYAPQARLTLTHEAKTCSGVIVGYTDRSYPHAQRLFALGSSSSPEAVAENLYAILRQLDEEGIETAFVDTDFPKSGIWSTIEERLQKAAQT